MQIYIASSWKNQHAVELLTSKLREKGHVVKSFVENEHGEDAVATDGHVLTLAEWVASEAGRKSFLFDVGGATESDLVIYIGPSGNDAWAEVGAAWASGVPVYGLWAKAEQVGLQRRMVEKWFTNYHPLLEAVEKYALTTTRE